MQVGMMASKKARARVCVCVCVFLFSPHILDSKLTSVSNTLMMCSFLEQKEGNDSDSARLKTTSADHYF